MLCLEYKVTREVKKRPSFANLSFFSLSLLFYYLSLHSENKNIKKM